jgi:hypothetical protein
VRYDIYIYVIRRLRVNDVNLTQIHLSVMYVVKCILNYTLKAQYFNLYISFHVSVIYPS